MEDTLADCNNNAAANNMADLWITATPTAANTDDDNTKADTSSTLTAKTSDVELKDSTPQSFSTFGKVGLKKHQMLENQGSSSSSSHVNVSSRSGLTVADASKEADGAVQENTAADDAYECYQEPNSVLRRQKSAPPVRRRAAAGDGAQGGGRVRQVVSVTDDTAVLEGICLDRPGSDSTSNVMSSPEVEDLEIGDIDESWGAAAIISMARRVSAPNVIVGEGGNIAEDVPDMAVIEEESEYENVGVFDVDKSETADNSTVMNSSGNAENINITIEEKAETAAPIKIIGLDSYQPAAPLADPPLTRQKSAPVRRHVHLAGRSRQVVSAADDSSIRTADASKTTADVFSFHADRLEGHSTSQVLNEKGLEEQIKDLITESFDDILCDPVGFTEGGNSGVGMGGPRRVSEPANLITDHQHEERRAVENVGKKRVHSEKSRPTAARESDIPELSVWVKPDEDDLVDDDVLVENSKLEETDQDDGDKNKNSGGLESITMGDSDDICKSTPDAAGVERDDESAKDEFKDYYDTQTDELVKQLLRDADGTQPILRQRPTTWTATPGEDTATAPTATPTRLAVTPRTVSEGGTPRYHHAYTGEGNANLEHVDISILSALLDNRSVSWQEKQRLKRGNKFYNSLDSRHIDDEHKLIARYAATLASAVHNKNNYHQTHRQPSDNSFSLETSHAQRDLITQLERKNREIMREIQHLRYEQEQQNLLHLSTPSSTRNPTLLAELRLLRQRRDELETRMTSLQDSRKELMVQLEGLMKLLKSHSPRASPTTSPRSHDAHSSSNPTMMTSQTSPYPGYTSPYPTRAASAPPTPGESLNNLSGDVSQAFGRTHSITSSLGGQSYTTGGSVRSLRQDLLVAADSVTNAMSSLVKELNSEASSSEDESMKSTENGLDISSRLDELAAWREEMKQHTAEETEFIAQLEARHNNIHTNPQHHHHTPPPQAPPAHNSSKTHRHTPPPQYNSHAPPHTNTHGGSSSVGPPPHTHRHANHANTTSMENHYAVTTYTDPYRSQTSGDEGDPFAKDEQHHRRKAAAAANAAAAAANVNSLRSHGYDGNAAKDLQIFPNKYLTDDESCLETDQESYIRTDDEEGGNTEWEESMRRWVNR